MSGLTVRQVWITLKTDTRSKPAESNTVRNAILRQQVVLSCMLSRTVMLKLKLVSVCQFSVCALSALSR